MPVDAAALVEIDAERSCGKQLTVCIDEPITFYFEARKSVPIAAYAEELDETADEMKQTNPDVELVEIRGFRSGNEPRTISHQRAASVHAALVQRGVDAARLVIVDRGVGPPTTSAGGQRRVELAIVKQRVGESDAEIIECTPMGRYFKRMTDAERSVACH